MNTRSNWRPRLCLLAYAGLGPILFAVGCATGQGDSGWITIGKTTRQEVLERYGEPDLVRVSADGEVAMYGMRNSAASSGPPPVAQVAEPAPEGKMTFQPHPIIRGLGARDIGAGTPARPQREIHLRYDAQGIVREVRDADAN